MKFIESKIKNSFPNAEEISVTRKDAYARSYIAEWSVRENDRVMTMTMNIDAADDGRIANSTILIRERKNAWIGNAADEDRIYPSDEDKPLTSVLSEARSFCRNSLGLLLEAKDDQNQDSK